MSKNKNCSELPLTNGMELDRAPVEIFTFIFSTFEVKPPSQCRGLSARRTAMKSRRGPRLLVLNIEIINYESHLMLPCHTFSSVFSSVSRKWDTCDFWIVAQLAAQKAVSFIIYCHY